MTKWLDRAHQHRQGRGINSQDSCAMSCVDPDGVNGIEKSRSNKVTLRCRFTEWMAAWSRCPMPSSGVHEPSAKQPGFDNQRH